MAYRIRVINKKQELRQPDEFISTMDWFGEVVRSNTKSISFLAGLIVLVGGAIGGGIWYQVQQEESAAEIELRATRFYHQPMPPSLPGVEGESWRKENLDKAIELYQEVVAKYSGTRSAALSQYYLGNSHLELGEYDQAVNAYQNFYQKYQESPILLGLAHQRQGYAFLAKGDLKAAQGAFEAAIRIDQALNKDQVLFEIGRLFETQGNKDGAVQQYQKVIQEHPASLLTAEARIRLRELGVEVPGLVGTDEESEGVSSPEESSP